MKKELKQTIENFEVYYSDNDGYEIRSIKTGLEYSLLEMKSFMGSSTSDMIVIMVSVPEQGYTGMLTYFFGADENAIDCAISYIKDFELGHKKMISYIDLDELTELNKCLNEKQIYIRLID